MSLNRPGEQHIVTVTFSMDRLASVKRLQSA